jgi:hypothetical protein
MGFMVGLFLLLNCFKTLLSSLKSFFITKNLVIIYKLNTIQSLYYKEKDFVTIFVFLGFYHNPKKIAKEEEFFYKI